MAHAAHLRSLLARAAPAKCPLHAAAAVAAPSSAARRQLPQQLHARLLSSAAASTSAPAVARGGTGACRQRHVHASAGSSSQGQAATREDHNKLQGRAFSAPDVVQRFMDPVDEAVQERVARIVRSVPGLDAGSRVVDVGSGTGCLIPHLQARGVQDILAVDLSEPMLAHVRQQHAAGATTLGNQLGVRTWLGDVVDLPNYLGWGADAFFFNGMFGNMHDPRAALLRASLQLKAGGHIVISHPMGRAWHSRLAAAQPAITPHALPSAPELDRMVAGLPLRVVELADEPELYLAVLQVPPRYAFPGSPVRMRGPVVVGFGRGSKQMGVPTANIDPKPLEATLKAMANGVYYGFAQVTGPVAGLGPQDLAVHKMVMNVGNRPTVNKGDEEPSVEVHVLHKFPADFYGQEIRVVVLGFIRPEMRFPGGFPELLNRIKLDIAVGTAQAAAWGDGAALLDG